MAVLGRILRLTAWLLALLLVLVVVFVATEPGTRAVLAMARALSDGSLSYRAVSGTLPRGLEFTALALRTRGFALRIDDGLLDVDLLRLTAGEVRVRRVRAREIDIALVGGDEEPASDAGVLSLPVRITVDKLTVDRLHVRSGDAEPLLISDLRLTGRVSRSGTVRVREFAASHQGRRLSLRGRADISPPHAHQVEARLTTTSSAAPRLDVDLDAKGDSASSRITLTTRGLADIEADVVLAQWLEAPRASVDATFQARPLASAPDALALAGTLTGDLGLGTASTLAFTLDVDSVAHGRWSGAGELGADPAQAVALRTLRVDGPDGAVVEAAGQLSAAGFDPRGLSLRLSWRALASPAIDAVRSPRGELELRYPDALQGEFDAALAIAGAKQPLNVAGALEYRPGSLRARKLTLARGDARLELTGDIGLDAGRALAVRGSWTDVALPEAHAVTLASPSGRLSVTGSVDDFDLHVNGDLLLADNRQGMLSLNARGSSTGFRHLGAQLQAGNLNLSAEGFLEWSGGLQWQFAVNGDNVDPGLVHPDWPGQMRFAVLVAGQLRDEVLRLRLNIDDMAGQLRGLPISGRGLVRRDAEGIAFEALRLASGRSSLEADGRLAPGSALRWRIDSPDLSDWSPGLGGRVDASGVLTGAVSAPLLQAGIRMHALSAGAVAVDALAAEVDIDTSVGGRLEITADGEGLRLPNYRFESLRARLNGTVEQHRFSLGLPGDALGLSLSGEGALTTGPLAWEGSLEALALTLAGSELRLEAPARVRIGEVFSIVDACLSGPPGRLCADGERGGEDNWRLALRGDGIDLAAVPIGGLELSGQLDRLRLDAAGIGTRLDAFSAAAQAQRTDLALRARGETPVTISLREVALDARATAQGSAVDIGLLPGFEGASEVSASLTLPATPWQLQDWRSLPIAGSARMHLESLAVLDELTTQVDKLSGSADLSLSIAGTAGAPTLLGDARVDEVSALVPGLGLQPSVNTLELRISDSGLFAMEGELTSGGGSARVEAEGELRGTQPVRLRLTGNDVLVANLPEAEVRISPELLIEYLPGEVLVNGSVRIPSARIAPSQFSSGGVTPSKDVVVVDADRGEAGDKLNLYSEVRIELGDDVHFSARGFNTRIAGALTVSDTPGKPTVASGELRLIDGAYTAYGQALSVESGRIFFAGGPIDDPAVEATAVREVDTVRAGIKLSGRLREPVVSLFSTPIMDDRDILSYILLGRALGGASESDANMLMNAATSIGLKRGTMISQGIASRFGIDDFSLSGSPQEGQMELTVGKYLSPKLYLGYGVGLLEPSNIVLIRYDIFDNWQLEAETGTKTGADILYTIER